MAGTKRIKEVKKMLAAKHSHQDEPVDPPSEDEIYSKVDRFHQTRDKINMGSDVRRIGRGLLMFQDSEPEKEFLDLSGNESDYVASSSSDDDEEGNDMASRGVYLEYAMAYMTQPIACKRRRTRNGTSPSASALFAPRSV